MAGHLFLDAEQLCPRKHVQLKASRQLEPVLLVFLLSRLEADRSTQVQRETDDEQSPICEHDCLSGCCVDTERIPCLFSLAVEEDHMRVVVCLSEDDNKGVVEGRGGEDDLRCWLIVFLEVVGEGFLGKEESAVSHNVTI